MMESTTEVGWHAWAFMEGDHCHICIGLVGYLGFILGDLNEYLCDIHPFFSNYARFWFVEC